MGLQQVTDEILDEAEEKADQLKQEAEEEADEITSEAEERANEIKSEAEEEIEEEKQALKQKEMSKAKMEANKKVQRAKQSEIEKAFNEFRSTLSDLNKSEREEMVENAVEAANFEVSKVRGSADFEDVVEKEFEEMDEEGLVLESGNGEKSLNLTFDRIREEFKQNFRSEVARTLFEEVEK